MLTSPMMCSSLMTVHMSGYFNRLRLLYTTGVLAQRRVGCGMDGQLLLCPSSESEFETTRFIVRLYTNTTLQSAILGHRRLPSRRRPCTTPIRLTHLPKASSSNPNLPLARHPRSRLRAGLQDSCRRRCRESSRLIPSPSPASTTAMRLLPGRDSSLGVRERV